jgi:hypothetical protein
MKAHANRFSIAILLARMFSMSMAKKHGKNIVSAGVGFGGRKGMIDLSGIPPAWKGRRMSRIMRGGK